MKVGVVLHLLMECFTMSPQDTSTMKAHGYTIHTVLLGVIPSGRGAAQVSRKR